MARPESIAVGGYYPTPDTVLDPIASLVEWSEHSARGFVLDPCAGAGGAVSTLRETWSVHAASRYAAPRIVAAELEGERASALSRRLELGRGDRVFHGDAFRLVISDYSTGATVLFLNPPYDRDAEFGRLEHRFLTRFTAHLHAGCGFLLYLVPHTALHASADFLPGHYAELRCWRLPSAEFERFGQVLVTGRRRARAVPSAEHSIARVRSWAEQPERLPVLPDHCPDPFVVPGRDSVLYSLDYRLAETDLSAVSEAFDPWPGAETGGRHDVGQLLGARFPVALPPRPAHIALALASGMFNGHRLEPDEPERFPPVLAKGSYSRESVEVERRMRRDGSASVTTIDRPRLRVTVLDLETSAFHTLAEGTEPAGGDDLARWTAADLLVHYGRSMADLMRRQFPALHDPARPADHIELPTLARRPYPVQDHAVQAALKLLATGRNPFFPAEVGTGKTTMALYVAAALGPDHYGETVRQLRAAGFPSAPAPVRRTLVLCPPHLLGSWRDQAGAVVPHARVQIVETARDLEADAELFILSRERAKLGHGHRGLTGPCPRCGAPVETDAETNASRRLHCQARTRRPANPAARLARKLATLLAPVAPEDDLVASLAPARLLRRSRASTEEALPVAALKRFRDHLVHRLVPAITARPATRPPAHFYDLVHLLRALTLAVGSTLPALARRLLALADETPHPSAAGLLRTEARKLAHHDETTTPPERRLLGVLEDLDHQARWHTSPPCGEPLYEATEPRRVPLAKVILQRHRRRFDLLILDEAHEFNNRRSAQAKAAHRLTALPGVPTLVLTGSLMGGYASSLFANFHALSAAFRSEFSRDEQSDFVARYGYRKVRLTERSGDDSRQLGRHTDRELWTRRVIGEAPGVHPLFLMRYLLPTAVPVHKDDLEHALPPLTETPVPLEPAADDPSDRDLLGEYARLQDELLACIRRDRSDPELAGRLLGALVELPSYLDRASEDLEPFVLRYPDSVGGAPIATAQSFPTAWHSPKERWLLDEVERRVAAGERVLVFVSHSRTRLPHRLLRLLETVAPGTVWLDTRKVPTRRREAWIDRHVNDPEAPVLVVNPNAVRTGLNNLVGFSTAIWYELDYSAFTYRQAIGRLHRIGQERPVEILIPYYAGTAQEVAFELVAKKVSASLQVDGLDVRAALEAAGAGDLPDGLDAALSLGRAVYRALVGEAA